MSYFITIFRYYKWAKELIKWKRSITRLNRELKRKSTLCICWNSSTEMFNVQICVRLSGWLTGLKMHTRTLAIVPKTLKCINRWRNTFPHLFRAFKQLMYDVYCRCLVCAVHTVFDTYSNSQLQRIIENIEYTWIWPVDVNVSVSVYMYVWMSVCGVRSPIRCLSIRYAGLRVHCTHDGHLDYHLEHHGCAQYLKRQSTQKKNPPFDDIIKRRHQ